MDNSYLQELINEAKARDGGLILNLNGRPEVVVLTVEKYNQLISESANQRLSEQADQANSFKPKTILVTGGAGYIGSHLTRELLKQGHKVVVLDNLSSGKRENVPDEAVFVEGDLADVNLLRDLFAANNFDAVMHMAASIEVEESVNNPQKYFENNAVNTAKLLSVMNEANVKKIIFSSTCAVFGDQAGELFGETAPVKPNNPYGFSKAMAEKSIKYYCQFVGFDAAVLRYFNAGGSSLEAEIKPTHVSHLLPIIFEVAAGLRPYITINGNDYQTPDGTCVRDFVHVLDIAGAHLKALDYLASHSGFHIFNIGTGSGASVLQMINATAEVLNKMIPMEIGPRRAGDAAMLIADNSKMVNELGYRLEYSDLPTIISSSWAQFIRE